MSFAWWVQLPYQVRLSCMFDHYLLDNYSLIISTTETVISCYQAHWTPILIYFVKCAFFRPRAVMLKWRFFWCVLNLKKNIHVYINMSGLMKTVLKNSNRALSGIFFFSPEKWRYKNWKESQSFFSFLYPYIFLSLLSFLYFCSFTGLREGLKV